MPRYTIKLKRTAGSFIHEYECDAADQAAADAVAAAMAAEAGGGFDAPTVTLDPHSPYQKESEKGSVNGYAGLDAAGLVPVAQLPGLPAAWGSITGTLSVQTDLQTALDAKSGTGHNHAGTYEPANANIQAHVASAHAPSDAQKNSDITKAEIEAKLIGEIASHTHAGGGSLTLADVYPVGCIYTTIVSTNPATVFGFGTWSAFGAGRVLVGLDSGNTAFDTVEETGGAKTVAAAGRHRECADLHRQRHQRRAALRRRLYVQAHRLMN